MTYNEIKNDPTHVESVAKRRAERDKIFAEYTPQLWEKVKARMLKKPFPQAKLGEMVAYGDNRLKTSVGKHWVDNEAHKTTKHTYYEDFMAGLFGIDWSYQYCNECSKVVKKSATFFNAVTNASEAHDYTDGTPKPYISRGDMFAHSSAEMSEDANAGLIRISEVFDFTPESLYAEGGVK